MPIKLRSISSVGLFGFGAFGRLIGAHLSPYVPFHVFDPAAPAIERTLDERIAGADIATVAACEIVILAVPVGEMAQAIRAIRPHLRPGAVVLDVGSVKLMPTRVMQAELPDHVEIIGTHPLFGPQSARHGIKGLKIALCPIRGGSIHRIAAFLRRALGLRVLITTAEAHDREAALAQELTHLIAKVLLQMEPLPTRLTTVSFDLLVQAMEMVRHDPPSVFLAIERDNPHAAPVRERFFAIAEAVRCSLETHQQLRCDDGAGAG